MRSLKFAAAICALAATVFSVPAAASTFSPAAPLPFELVNLRMTVDSCAFDPSTVFVGNNGSAIQVRLSDRQCFAPGTPTEVDIRLGAFPVGLYNVEVVSLVGGDAVVVRERLQFSVIPRAVIAIFPPPPFPLTDYTGLWYNPTQPGWGISIHQNPSDSLFAASFEYTGSNPGQPTWRTFQSGQWTSSTKWQGTAYRTTFPLAVENLGPVTIEFDVPAPQGAPAGLRWGRVTYLVGGDAVATQFITRQLF